MARIVHVTRARAPYLRALQESFAKAMGGSGSLHVLWPQREPSDFPDAAAVPVADNIHVTEVAMGRTVGNGRRLPSSALWRALDEARPDLVWVHEFSPYTVAGLCYAKRRGLPVVVSTEVGRRNAHFFPWPVRLWHRHWGHFADGIIANCPAAREPLCDEARPVVDAFHAVDSRDFVPAPNQECNGTATFAFVGHLIPRKGVDLLLDAALALKQQGVSGFRINLIGRDHEGWAAREVAARGLETTVDMSGFLSGEPLQDAIRAADVFVLPTRKDTYAAVVHEAACLGMPLLVSRHAGACEALVREGVTGFSFLPEDSGGFAEQMRRMLDSGLRQRMREASRAAGDALSAHRRGPALWEWMRREFAV
jgi:glycosyltransferase involved in cell wall biosynthesis